MVNITLLELEGGVVALCQRERASWQEGTCSFWNFAKPTWTFKKEKPALLAAGKESRKCPWCSPFFGVFQRV